MSELTLVGLRVVQEVAARGSFTAAADALGYTQSAVSRQVAAMEQAAGAPLFERLARGVRPTGAGNVLLRHACCSVGGRRRRDARARRAARPPGGSARRRRVPLGTRGARAARARTPAPRAPRRDRDATRGLDAHALRRVRAGRLEVAVVALDRYAPPALDDLRVERLLEGRLLVAVPAAHRLAHAARSTSRSWRTSRGSSGTPIRCSTSGPARPPRGGSPMPYANGPPGLVSSPPGWDHPDPSVAAGTPRPESGWSPSTSHSRSCAQSSP